MRELIRQVGSVHNLIVFEAAARLESFSKAASELGLTQPAVSQAIRRLETALGAPLFRRSHRAVHRNDAGERLFADVAEGFGRMLATARQLRRAASSKHATLMVSTAFATWWMVPRLADFRRRHPHVDLRLETRNRDVDVLDEPSSLSVRRGTGPWPGHRNAVITAEELFVVASPRLFTTLPRTPDLHQLASLPLIHLDEPHRMRPNWSDFLRHFGARLRDRGEGLRLNDYALVLQAAMAGEGLAIGWRHICERPLSQGLLVRVGPWSWQTGAAFHLLWSATQSLSEAALLVRDWMLLQGRQQAA